MNIEKLISKFRFSTTNLLIVLSIVVGLATSIGALGFIALIEYFNSIFFGLTDQVLTKAMGEGNIKFWLPLCPKGLFVKK